MADGIRFSRWELEDEAALAAFNRLIAFGQDMSPVLHEIGATLEASTRQRFEDGIGPDGVAWQPSQRAILTGGQTLVDTGRLRGSISYQVEGDEVLIGTNVIYAAIHQMGGRIEAKDGGRLAFRLPDGGYVTPTAVEMPARPFLGVSAEDAEDIHALVVDHAEGLLQ